MFLVAAACFPYAISGAVPGISLFADRKTSKLGLATREAANSAEAYRHARQPKDRKATNR